jgi:hypothetical protein
MNQEERKDGRNVTGAVVGILVTVAIVVELI